MQLFFGITRKSVFCWLLNYYYNNYKKHFHYTYFGLESRFITEALVTASRKFYSNPKLNDAGSVHTHDRYMKFAKYNYNVRSRWGIPQRISCKKLPCNISCGTSYKLMLKDKNGTRVHTLRWWINKIFCQWPRAFVCVWCYTVLSLNKKEENVFHLRGKSCSIIFMIFYSKIKKMYILCK